jgi:hypothetical protein
MTIPKSGRDRPAAPCDNHTVVLQARAVALSR